MGHLHWFFNQLALMQWDAVRCSRTRNNAVLHSPTLSLTVFQCWRRKNCGVTPSGERFPVTLVDGKLQRDSEKTDRRKGVLRRSPTGSSPKKACAPQ